MASIESEGARRLIGNALIFGAVSGAVLTIAREVLLSTQFPIPGRNIDTAILGMVLGGGASLARDAHGLIGIKEGLANLSRRSRPFCEKLIRNFSCLPRR